MLLSRDVTFQEVGNCQTVNGNDSKAVRNEPRDGVLRFPHYHNLPETEDESSEEEEEEGSEVTDDESIEGSNSNDNVNDESEEEPQGTHHLRDRTNLRKPLYLDDYVTEAEAILNNPPKTYEDAMSNGESDKWKEEMGKEMSALHENGTW